jgi:glycosyltransferase involved in cell wall biosynthesis
MAESPASSLKRVVIDMTPLLPGGGNGGVRLVPLAILPHLPVLAPEIDFTLLTHQRSHDSLAEFDAPNVHRLVVTAADSDIVPTPTPLAAFTSRLRRQAGRFLPKRVRRKLRGVAPPRSSDPRTSSLINELRADLVFCPFTAPFYFDPRVPLLSVVLDLQYLQYPQFFSGEERAIRGWTFASACQVADRLICISDFVRGTVLENSNVSPDRAVTVHLGRLQELPAQQPHRVAEALERLELTAGRFLLYPANFWPHKNHRMLITAFALFRSWHPESDLQLVCTGTPDAEMDVIRAATETMGIDDAVVFTGFVSGEDLAALYQSCQALVFPSLYEGFGMPVVEAMAFGKPVLCSNLTSLPEVVGDAALLFDPRKPDEIARGIEDIDGDADLRCCLARRGRDRATQFGDGASLAEAYLRIFRELVNRNARDFADALHGVHPDGWVGNSMAVSYNGSSPPRTLELVLSAPEWLPSESVTIVVHDSASTALASHRVARGQHLPLHLELAPSGGVVELEFSPVFVPASLGLEGDDRELVCVCETARLVGPGGSVDLRDASQAGLVHA